MKRLRFLCFASLFAFAIILLSSTSDLAVSPAQYCAPKPPTLAPSAENITTENLREVEVPRTTSSATITITMTGKVGDPGDKSQRR